ncbi:MAG: hypothetical protein ACQEUT_03005 [Bacillota bacterium]
MAENRKIVFALLVVGLIGLLLTSYIKDQPIREVSWQYIEKKKWEQDGAGKWFSTVSTTTAGHHDSHHLYDTSYNGQRIYMVKFFGGNGLNGVPTILISKETNKVVGIIPTE